MYSPILQDILLSYSLQNDRRVLKMIKANGEWLCKLFIKETLESSVPSQKIREMLVALYMGMRHNAEVNGADAISRKGLPWEIKTEQSSRNKLQGISTWHYSNPENLKKYLTQRILQAGYYEGKLVYIVSWDILESNIIPQLKLQHKQGTVKNGVKLACSAWSQFDSLKLHFLRTSYANPKYMKRGLLETLEELAEDFEGTADII